MLLDPVPQEIKQQHVGSNTQARPEIEREATGKEYNPSKKAIDLEDMLLSDVTSYDVQVELDEFFIDSMIDHKINLSKRHRYSKYGDSLYKIHWYEYKPK